MICPHIMYHYFFWVVVLIFCKKTALRALSAVIALIIGSFALLPLCVNVSAKEVEKELAVQKMKDGFYNYEQKIDLSGCGVTPENVGEIFAFALKNDPFLFFVDTKLSYLYKSDGSVMEIFPRYVMTADAAAERIAFCVGEISKIASRVDPRMTDAEKALFMHDLICREYSYDISLQNDDMYDFLSSKTGTCQGYAWTYMAVMRELGIGCCYAASDTINHIWNMVKIGGEWYHCDLTWDDNATNATDRRHFLNSDKKAASQGHKDWYSAYGEACASEKFDAADLSPLTHRLYSGDTDHGGALDLYDLLLLRQYEVRGNGAACAMCADMNADLVCDGADAEIMRQLLLAEN